MTILTTFLNSVTSNQFPGDGTFHIVDDDTYKSVEELTRLIRKTDLSAKLQLMQMLIAEISKAPIISDELKEVLEVGSGELLKNIAAIARMVQYQKTYESLSQLVNESEIKEQSIQDLLSKNPWLFGSEYSELIDRRSWTRDNRLDFMLRRTVDDYLEIIEIKTPFRQPLLIMTNLTTVIFHHLNYQV